MREFSLVTGLKEIMTAEDMKNVILAREIPNPDDEIYNVYHKVDLSADPIGKFGMKYFLRDPGSYEAGHPTYFPFLVHPKLNADGNYKLVIGKNYYSKYPGETEFSKLEVVEPVHSGEQIYYKANGMFYRCTVSIKASDACKSIIDGLNLDSRTKPSAPWIGKQLFVGPEMPDSLSTDEVSTKIAAMASKLRLITEKYDPRVLFDSDITFGFNEPDDWNLNYFWTDPEDYDMSVDGAIVDPRDGSIHTEVYYRSPDNFPFVGAHYLAIETKDQFSKGGLYTCKKESVYSETTDTKFKDGKQYYEYTGRSYLPVDLFTNSKVRTKDRFVRAGRKYYYLTGPNLYGVASKVRSGMKKPKASDLNSAETYSRFFKTRGATTAIKTADLKKLNTSGYVPFTGVPDPSKKYYADAEGRTCINDKLFLDAPLWPKFELPPTEVTSSELADKFIEITADSRLPTCSNALFYRPGIQDVANIYYIESGSGTASDPFLLKSVPMSDCMPVMNADRTVAKIRSALGISSTTKIYQLRLDVHDFYLQTYVMSDDRGISYATDKPAYRGKGTVTTKDLRYSRVAVDSINENGNLITTYKDCLVRCDRDWFLANGFYEYTWLGEASYTSWTERVPIVGPQKGHDSFSFALCKIDQLTSQQIDYIANSDLMPLSNPFYESNGRWHMTAMDYLDFYYYSADANGASILEYVKTPVYVDESHTVLIPAATGYESFPVYEYQEDILPFSELANLDPTNYSGFNGTVYTDLTEGADLSADELFVSLAVDEVMDTKRYSEIVGYKYVWEQMWIGAGISSMSTTNIEAYTYNNKLYISWTDPEFMRDDENPGAGAATWTKTSLVIGAEFKKPASGKPIQMTEGGRILFTSTTKNEYKNKFLVLDFDAYGLKLDTKDDTDPNYLGICDALVNGKHGLALIATADNEIINPFGSNNPNITGRDKGNFYSKETLTNSCAHDRIITSPLTWSTVSHLVRLGHAKSLFSIGDVWTLPYNSELKDTVTAKVVAFNKVTTRRKLPVTNDAGDSMVYYVRKPIFTQMRGGNTQTGEMFKSNVTYYTATYVPTNDTTVDPNKMYFTIASNVASRVEASQLEGKNPKAQGWYEPNTFDVAINVPFNTRCSDYKTKINPTGGSTLSSVVSTPVFTASYHTAEAYGDALASGYLEIGNPESIRTSGLYNNLYEFWMGDRATPVYTKKDVEEFVVERFTDYSTDNITFMLMDPIHSKHVATANASTARYDTSLVHSYLSTIFAAFNDEEFRKACADTIVQTIGEYNGTYTVSSDTPTAYALQLLWKGTKMFIPSASQMGYSGGIWFLEGEAFDEMYHHTQNGVDYSPNGTMSSLYCTRTMDSATNLKSISTTGMFGSYSRTTERSFYPCFTIN